MEYIIKNDIVSPLWIRYLLATTYASIHITATSSTASVFWITRLNHRVVTTISSSPTQNLQLLHNAPYKSIVETVFNISSRTRSHSIPTCNKLPYFRINRFSQQSQQGRYPTNILHCYFIFISGLAKNKVSEGTTSILLNFQNSVVQKINQMLDSP